MTTYISILRGINVNGQKLIKMGALKIMYEKRGFENVKTYIQSGNVIFKTLEMDEKILEKNISSSLKEDFGFEVSIIVLSIDTWKGITENNPFLKEKLKDPQFFHVTFLANNPSDIDKEQIIVKKQANEEIAFSTHAVYLYCPNGYGKTKLNNNFLEAKLKVRATTRNWKTVNELLKLAQT